MQKLQGGKSLAGAILNPGLVRASGEKQHLEKRVWDEVHRSWHVFLFCSKNNEEQLGSLSICSSPTLQSCLVIVAQLCPTLYNPMDCSPPGSSVHEDSPSKNIRVGCLDPQTQKVSSVLAVFCKQKLWG